MKNDKINLERGGEMKKYILLILMVVLLGGCQDRIINTSHTEFNVNELIDKNDFYRDDVPILVLLQNDHSTLITIVSQGANAEESYYFSLDSTIVYNILKQNENIYIQNNEKCFLLDHDGTIKENEMITENYDVILPVYADSPSGYYYKRDCSISEADEAYKENYELIFLEGYFDYKDYELVSFTRLCDYLT